MPALVAFGRRWQIASDDFVFPGFIDVLIHVGWLIAACIVYWQHESNLTCEGGHYMKVYLYGSFAIHLGIVFSNIALVQNSMDGPIMDLEARKYVAPCLYLRMVLEIPEVGWNVLGTIWVFSASINCLEAPDSVLLMKALIIVNWIFIGLVIISIAIVFDPLGSGQNFDDDEYERFESGMIHHGNRHTRIWERRCRFLLCGCISTGNDNTSRDAFKEVGKILAFLFEDLDLVPSDLAAGLIILHLKNQAEANTLQNSSQFNPITSEPESGDFYGVSSGMESGGNWNSPQTISHFMKYALGSYGWPWYLAAYPKTGLCRLYQNLLCCGCCVSHPYSVEGDNCCFCNTSALKNTTKVNDQDLLFASFHNHIFKTPFFISIDHNLKSIVIAIRGSMSYKDAITDLTAEAKPLDVPGLPPGCKAHFGILLSAKHVLEKLEKLGVLDRAATAYPNYTLVITGHSLGAGAATILAIMLRSRFPTLRCYAYSPPGGLLTSEAAEYCESFTISVVVGDDVIVRMSVPTFEKFKTKLIRAIKDCRAPKYRILVRGCCYFLMGGIPNLNAESPGETGGGEREEQSSDTNLLQSETTNYHTYVSLAEVSHRMQRESVTSCPMYPPGKIMHVTERPIFQSRPDLVDGPRYEYRWAERSEFGEIRVTPKMGSDHYPDTVYRALRDIANADVSAPFYSVI